MKSVIKILGRYKKETIFAPLFKLLEASFELFVPLVVASLIDNGILKENKEHIVYSFLLLVLLAVIGLISSVTAQYFSAKAAIGVSTQLRSEMFAKIQSFSFSELDRLGTSAMITRMTSDINQVQNGVNMFLRLFLRSPFIVFGAMIMAFTVDVNGAMVFVGTIPVLSIVVFAIILISIPLYQKSQHNLDNLTAKTRENLSGVRVIRAFCQEEKEIQEFHTLNEMLNKSQKYVGRISALMNPITYVIVNVAIILLIYVGALRVESGIITQGAVVALYNYMSQILVELIKLANLIITLTKSVACAKRVETILAVKSTLETMAQSDEKAILNTTDYIVFQNVGLTYQNAGEESLSDISFTVKKGETVGIIGGTGSGKSSLVHLIPHFYDCTRGNVYIDGINVKAFSPEKLREKVGIVLQKAVLFKGSIKENILWGNPNATEEDIDKAIKISQSEDVLSAKANNLEEIVEQGGRNFSGGQKQRLTIARAVVRNPEILILDDSASALDYATDAKLRQAIKSFDKEMTVFIVSQRTSSMLSADKILVLDDGRIVGMGTHEELLKNCGIYKEIHLSQTK